MTRVSWVDDRAAKTVTSPVSVPADGSATVSPDSVTGACCDPLSALIVRACVVSHAVPSIRNEFPSVSASTWPRTCTQRVLPSGQQTLYSAWYAPRVLTALSTTAVTQAMTTG